MTRGDATHMTMATVTGPTRARANIAPQGRAVTARANRDGAARTATPVIDSSKKASTVFAMALMTTAGARAKRTAGVACTTGGADPTTDMGTLAEFPGPTTSAQTGAPGGKDRNGEDRKST